MDLSSFFAFSPLNAFLAIFAWFILSRGLALQRLFGQSGTRIFTRIMGLHIASIGVAFVREGAVAVAESVTG